MIIPIIVYSLLLASIRIMQRSDLLVQESHATNEHQCLRRLGSATTADKKTYFFVSQYDGPESHLERDW